LCHQQPLRKCSEIRRSRRRNRAIPGIDDVSACEHGQPCQRGHGDEIDAEEFFVTLAGQRLVVRAIAAVELDQRAGTSQQIERTEAHAVDEGPETARRHFHVHHPFMPMFLVWPIDPAFLTVASKAEMNGSFDRC